MKRFLTIISTFVLLFSPISLGLCEEKLEDKNIQDVFQLDIKTLKYEQKQLVYAIITGNENSVRTILNSDPEPKTTYSKIPLTMFAIHSNQLKILKALIEDYKFDPNQTVLDVTPLEIAIVMKRYEIIEYLLSIGVEPNDDDIYYLSKTKDKKLKKMFE